MKTDVYQELCDTMAKKGGMYPGMDIPEFYALAEELFSPEEARLIVRIPKGFHSADAIADFSRGDPGHVADMLADMSQKGLCFSIDKDGTPFYSVPPFVPGIFEYQFMRGSATKRDKKLARLIRDYKAAVDKNRKIIDGGFPAMRVIPVAKTIEAHNIVHTYDQVKSYIETNEPLAVSTCYCRHQAKLIDEKSHCGAPDEVCLQFGTGAAFVIEKGMGRRIQKREAMQILDRAEDAGLVHCTNNRQEIDFLCNCCACHCVILKDAKAHTKPGLNLSSGFRPVWDADQCTACENCIERCPMDALQMGDDDLPQLDLDQCIGCGVCATGCPETAIVMTAREGSPVPPIDRKALKVAIQTGLSG